MAVVTVHRLAAAQQGAEQIANASHAVISAEFLDPGCASTPRGPTSCQAPELLKAHDLADEGRRSL